MTLATERHRSEIEIQRFVAHVILRAVCKCGRRQVAERTVGPLLILIHAPRFDQPLRVLERQELMHI